jgi:hypothetical protein
VKELDARISGADRINQLLLEGYGDCHGHAVGHRAVLGSGDEAGNYAAPPGLSPAQLGNNKR